MSDYRLKIKNKLMGQTVAKNLFTLRWLLLAIGSSSVYPGNDRGSDGQTRAGDCGFVVRLCDWTVLSHVEMS